MNENTGDCSNCEKLADEIYNLRSLVREMFQALLDCENGNCWRRGDISQLLARVPIELRRK